MGYTRTIGFIILLDMICLAAKALDAAVMDYRQSADGTMEIVYLNKTLAIEHYANIDALEKKTHHFRVTLAKYEGPPELAQFTGDRTIKVFVSSITEIRVTTNYVFGRGFDPNGNARTPSWFLFDLNTQRCVFYENELEFARGARRLAGNVALKFKPPIYVFDNKRQR